MTPSQSKKKNLNYIKTILELVLTRASKPQEKDRLLNLILQMGKVCDFPFALGLRGVTWCGS